MIYTNQQNHLKRCEDHNPHHLSLIIAYLVEN